MMSITSRHCAQGLIAAGRCRTTTLQSRLLSAKPTVPNPSVLQGDAGPLATRVHHSMTTGLAVATPLYFLVPDSYTDGAVNKVFGLALTAVISAHSFIGLNYVCTDYVPKISKSLLGPSRYVSAGLAAVTLLGMARMALSSPGGIKGVVKGVWNPKPKGKDILHDF